MTVKLKTYFTKASALTILYFIILGISACKKHTSEEPECDVNDQCSIEEVLPMHDTANLNWFDFADSSAWLVDYINEFNDTLHLGVGIGNFVNISRTCPYCNSESQSIQKEGKLAIFSDGGGPNDGPWVSFRIEINDEGTDDLFNAWQRNSYNLEAVTAELSSSAFANYDSINLNGKWFYDCYQFNPGGSNELFYTKTDGMVGYRDSVLSGLYIIDN